MLHRNSTGLPSSGVDGSTMIAVTTSRPSSPGRCGIIAERATCATSHIILTIFVYKHSPHERHTAGYSNQLSKTKRCRFVRNIALFVRWISVYTQLVYVARTSKACPVYIARTSEAYLSCMLNITQKRKSAFVMCGRSYLKPGGTYVYGFRGIRSICASGIQLICASAVSALQVSN